MEQSLNLISQRYCYNLANAFKFIGYETLDGIEALGEIEGQLLTLTTVVAFHFSQILDGLDFASNLANVYQPYWSIETEQFGDEGAKAVVERYTFGANSNHKQAYFNSLDFDHDEFANYSSSYFVPFDSTGGNENLNRDVEGIDPRAACSLEAIGTSWAFASQATSACRVLVVAFEKTAAEVVVDGKNPSSHLLPKYSVVEYKFSSQYSRTFPGYGCGKRYAQEAFVSRHSGTASQITVGWLAFPGSITPIAAVSLVVHVHTTDATNTGAFDCDQNSCII